MANGTSITVVTISYNCLADLQGTVESVLTQTSRPDNYVIIDGASTDGTLDYLEELQRREPWMTIVSEKDTGISNAMNKGMHHATGDWIAYVHSGDALHDERVIADLRPLLEEAEFGYLYGQLRVVDETGETVRVWDPPSYSQSLLLRRNFIPHPTVFFRTGLLIQLGGFDESIKIPMDYDLWLRAAKAGVRAQKVDRLISSFLDGGLSSNWWPMLMEEREVRLRNFPKGLLGSMFDFSYTCLRYVKNMSKNRG